MLVTVTRNPAWSDASGTEGMLDIDGIFQCYTMENTEDLIPEGIYDLAWYPSGEFRQDVPQVIVPGRTNIEIHPANWPTQLEGCTAVGERRFKDMIEQSDLAFAALKLALQLPCKIVYTRID
jgi:Family of unknown function (DUF5675)